MGSEDGTVRTKPQRQPHPQGPSLSPAPHPQPQHEPLAGARDLCCGVHACNGGRAELAPREVVTAEARREGAQAPRAGARDADEGDGRRRLRRHGRRSRCTSRTASIGSPLSACCAMSRICTSSACSSRIFLVTA